jgi:hypothetical protein
MVPDDLDPLIHDVRRLHENEISFCVGELKTRVHVRVHAGENDWYWWQQSHFIHTPVQLGPYTTSLPANDTEERAWRSAIWTLAQWYKDAVGAGETPAETWLVPNPDWR